MLALVYASVVFGLHFAYMNFSDYTSMIIAILFLCGIQRISIGILGEYVGRLYDQVKVRPLYIIANIESTVPHVSHGKHRP
jgi:polyisoprenyl-phosphate glycosyltransferase